ncbi:MAG TPA: PH domain-containing protein [Kineosporiaceae bacterium]|nr:PH domain-containing protein [Kineosporiaceae bacterium]
MPPVNDPAPTGPQDPQRSGDGDPAAAADGFRPPGDDLQARRAALHAPFHPLRARRMSRTIALVEFVVVGAPALFVAESGPGAFGWADRLSIVVLGTLIAAVIFRFSMLVAVPTEDGFTVHNLIRRTELEWAQIVSVRFGGGNPWVLLDLADGETLAVMAIQRADGARGEAEASRLATLVALHSQTPRNT